MPRPLRCESENLNVANDLADGSGYGDDAQVAKDAAQRDSIDNANTAAQAKLQEYSCEGDCEVGFAITFTDYMRPRARVLKKGDKTYFGVAKTKWQLDIFCKKRRVRPGRPRVSVRTMVTPVVLETMKRLRGKETESTWIAEAIQQRIVRGGSSKRKPPLRGNA